MSPQQKSPNIISRSNAGHYKWGKNCDAWHLLSTRRLSVIEERVPPGDEEAPHYHRYATQLFYLLQGQIRFTHATEVFDMQPGEAVHVLPGVLHKLENLGDEDAVLLVVSSPESHSDRYEPHKRGAQPAGPK